MRFSTGTPRGVRAVSAAAATVALVSLGSGFAEARATKATVTHVVCPAHARLGLPMSCGVSVSDRSAAATTPTGSVSLGANVSGSFGAGRSCTLRAVNRRTARCSFTFRSNHRRSVRIYGAYRGDSKHTASHGSANITVA